MTNQKAKRGMQTLNVVKYKGHFIEIDEDSQHRKHIAVRGVNTPPQLSVIFDETYDTVTESWRAAKKYVDKRSAECRGRVAERKPNGK